MDSRIASLVQHIWQFCWMGGFCLFVELHQEGPVPATWAAGLFYVKMQSYQPIYPRWKVGCWWPPLQSYSDNGSSQSSTPKTRVTYARDQVRLVLIKKAEITSPMWPLPLNMTRPEGLKYMARKILEASPCKPNSIEEGQKIQVVAKSYRNKS